jgi:hypothetical protein
MQLVLPVTKGVSHQMLKSGTKRRRTKQQIKDEKEAAQKKEIEI